MRNKSDRKSFIADFEQKLTNLFTLRLDPLKQNLQRGIPPFLLNEVLNLKPLSASIPTEFGGRGADPVEILSILETASYHSLPLSLMLGISGALFSEPLAKYGREDVKRKVFSQLMNNNRLGGLMITEPDFGTDALGMQTNYKKVEDTYHIQGTKHWAGLSGHADYWLMTARKQKDDLSLNRDIDFFLCDSSDPNQQVIAEEYYNNLGLYFIPYAKNRVDIHVPVNYKLEPKTTGIKLMQDLLHRSRMRFPGMALGFIKRMMDEAIAHTKERFIGGRPLTAFDQVQRRLAELQAWFTAASAFSKNAAEISGIQNDLEKQGLIANVHKTMLSEMMQKASQSLLTLVGAAGYRQDHLAGRSITDSRPFMIFEGSNDVIFNQIADSFVKGMERIKEMNLLNYIKTHPLTTKASDLFAKHINFNISSNLNQRKRVDLGELLGYIVTAQLTLELGESGFNKDLINNALSVFREKAASLVNSIHEASEAFCLEDYLPHSQWQESF
ncbi:acyl-CoA dehydrogenase family protein [Spirochaeta cellobiosiphila]|uniref:acyl-CoA dehydrogenase family protein n=1 Tax=Spirochaeta cellobiosiphila TaxID=504483 RepID=UPI00041A5C16|nr:acyl-CoA dehydrogenase family protein [Spirochaeta cellobiosiphila]